jgi:retron-type reverse transcriptase
MTSKNTHKKNIEQLESESIVLNKLNQLYSFNKKDLNKVNNNLIKIICDPDLLHTAYYKLKKNKGSMTVGTNSDTADSLDLERINKLSTEIKNGYQWSDVRKTMIPSKPGLKKKRPLGIPNFDDRIVQETIRIVLNLIYEPIFQSIEVNCGYRPLRDPITSILKLHRQSHAMSFAIEGDIVGAFSNVNHKVMINILKKKISDLKFLKLIETGLKHNFIFEGSRQKNLVGTPQGGIASAILFNIYMHEFDLFILKNLNSWVEEKNRKEERTNKQVRTLFTRRTSNKNDKLKATIKDLKYNKLLRPNTKEDFLKAKENIKKLRENKKLMLKNPNSKASRKTIRFSYSRYADDFILLTNSNFEEIANIKKIITNWLRNTLFLELDEKKTLTTDLSKSKARYLGFTLFLKKQHIQRQTKDGYILRRRSNKPLTIGIDHERLRDRLIRGKVISKNLVPTSNPPYISLKPHQIVTKYRQRVEGLFNYYYNAIHYPTELNFYHYAYKFSCLKTLARKKKQSMLALTLIYGKDIRIETEQKQTDSEGNTKIHKFSASYPTYKAIKKNFEKKKKDFKKAYYKKIKKKSKSTANPIELDNIISQDLIPFDPFNTNQIYVNLKSAYQLKTHCSVCGITPSPGNEIEMHHLKHVKKGKASGFTKIMRDLNRKTIPVCRDCHLKIHSGKYNGLSLSNLYDAELIQS